MSARAHHVSFREFVGPFAARTDNAKVRSATSSIGRLLRQLFDAATATPQPTELGRAYAYAYATRAVPRAR